MTSHHFPAIFRDSSLLTPAPANAHNEVIGVDPATGYHVLCDGHFDPDTVPPEIRAAKETAFADFLARLAKRLRARIHETRTASWHGDCQALIERDLMCEFAGYIDRRDLRNAVDLQDALLAQRADRLAGRPLPEWKNDGPARPAIRRAFALAAKHRKTADQISTLAA